MNVSIPLNAPEKKLNGAINEFIKYDMDYFLYND